MKITDPTSLALLDWLRKGGLDHEWKMNTTTCSTCHQKAYGFQSGKDLLFVLCPHCSNQKQPPATKAEGAARPAEVPVSAGVPSGASVGSSPSAEPASEGPRVPEPAVPQDSVQPPVPLSEPPILLLAQVKIVESKGPGRQTTEERRHPMAGTGTQLDDIIGGLPQGSLIAVSGLPGSGHDLFVRQILYNAAVAGTGVSYLAMDDSFERVTSEMLPIGFDVEALPREAWEFIDAHKVKRGELGAASLKMMLQSVANAAASGRWTCIDTFSNVAEFVGEDEAMSFLDDLVEYAREGRGVHFVILPDEVTNGRLNQLVSRACDGHITMELDEREAEPIGSLRIRHMSMMNHAKRSFSYAISTKGVVITTAQDASESGPGSSQPEGSLVSLPTTASAPAPSLSSSAPEPMDVPVQVQPETSKPEVAQRGEPSSTKRTEAVEPSGVMSLGGLQSANEARMKLAGSAGQSPYDGILEAIGLDERKNGNARLYRVYGLSKVPYQEFKLRLQSMQKKGLVRTKSYQSQVQVELTVLGTVYLQRHKKA